jgi:hypothetical protein
MGRNLQVGEKSEGSADGLLREDEAMRVDPQSLDASGI